MKAWPSEFKIGKCYYYYHDQKEISFLVLGKNKSEPWDRASTTRIKVFIDGKIGNIICYEWEEFWNMEK